MRVTTGGTGLGTGLGTAGTGLLTSGTALSGILSALLPGLGLGMLKGLFLAELLRPKKKGKSYGYSEQYHHKQRLGQEYPQHPQHPEYPQHHQHHQHHHHQVPIFAQTSMETGTATSLAAPATW